MNRSAEAPPATISLRFRLTVAIFAGTCGGALVAIAAFEAIRPATAGAVAAVDAALFPGAFGVGLAMAVAGVTAAVLAAPLGMFAAGGVRRRLRDLGRLAAALAQGRLDRRARTHPFDEIGELGLALNRMAERLGELTEQRQQLAALEERQRIARELHDSVAQQLFSLGSMAAAARRRLESLAAGTGAAGAEQAALLDRALADVADIDALARACHAEMRALIQQLRPPLLEKGPLAEALRRMAAEEAGRSRVQIAVRSTGTARTTAADAELLRVAQEAVTNAVRHGRPARVEIELAYHPGELRLEVRDDGAGFDPAAAIRPGAAGLAGMRERVVGLGGELAIDSAPRRGTRVRVRVPVKEDVD